MGLDQSEADYWSAGLTLGHPARASEPDVDRQNLGVPLAAMAAFAIFSSACSQLAGRDGGGGPAGEGGMGACTATAGGDSESLGALFCLTFGNCLEHSVTSCDQAICPACTLADAAALAGFGDAGLFTERCPGANLCSLSMLECLAAQGPGLLSPVCAAVFNSLFERGVEQLGDGGGTANACNPGYAGGGQGTGVDFCSAIGSCAGSSARCEQVICRACSAVDGIFLGSLEPWGSFGDLCPAFDQAAPCTDLACLVDAGPRVLSPSCAAAVASLAEHFLDGGFDGG